MATNTENKQKKLQEELPVPQSGSPPYPYRTAWAVVLLVGNFLVAAIYFHLINL
ncbi:MAG: photosystem one PsaX [Cyanobacteria bacterium QH_8_48_120]|jgi:photosystem I protein|nr:MAG: photosystem one PsaX [Cyanobacteria bacterium QH_1_48_107]PSO58862.1 MAG: photosystem one PsaX [Cyanobacteria bacterium QH_2_48_84]PSO59481.1 MAG: photosystem one PsaX [Cyanobacteria bacterium QH_10_48_56]PSO62210.1 MAG: photosystem one PsaX [Cyanobacteria bacterium QH_6_48_35]PSO67366.1 MAG: photosystem one PsaX [Cyanobacteria bacterium QH_7_48_89]PSO71919.1 MAG: photosystem one PsaX [Cyanobacteria bacterium QH_3_48_40]PSO73305.1 MAG: photosystem one PsaX [Cyanobacteria bacterium QS_